MIVVADTSPINYLILIDSVNLLPYLYGQVYLPQAVIDEMLTPLAPRSVILWAQNPPEWITILSPSTAPIQLSAILDLGESQAIQLAEELKADWLLIDEAAGRHEAQRLGLNVVGTLGILSRAHLAGLIVFTQAIDRLSQTNFRFSLSCSKNSNEAFNNRHLNAHHSKPRSSDCANL